MSTRGGGATSETKLFGSPLDPAPVREEMDPCPVCPTRSGSAQSCAIATSGVDGRTPAPLTAHGVAGVLQVTCLLPHVGRPARKGQIPMATPTSPSAGQTGFALPSKHLPAVTVRDMPEPPRQTWKIIGPGVVGAGIGLAS